MGDPDVRQPRVLMVIESAYPAPSGGGAEAQVRTLSAGLRRRHRRVTVLAPLFSRGPGERVSRVDGVPVCRLRYPRVRLLGGPILWLVLAIFLYRRRHRYDVWHVHIAHHVAAVCALMGDWLSKRVLVKVSGWWELERGVLAPRRWPLSRLAFLCLMRVDAWQAISRRIADTLAARGIPAERILLLPNAVDTARFTACAKHEKKTTHFLFIGRVVAEKDVDHLLDAFARIAPEFPQAKLTIVGAGPLLKSLKKRAAEAGIASAVTFPGHRDVITEFLRDATIGVLPSRIEGLSNTLLEYMASGLPVVATRISGNEDFIVNDVNGWLYEPGDREALTECLRKAAGLLPERREAMGQRARDTVLRRADIDHVLARLLAFYRGDAIPAVGSELPNGNA